jgi:hypothetical protein
MKDDLLFLLFAGLWKTSRINAVGRSGGDGGRCASILRSFDSLLQIFGLEEKGGQLKQREESKNASQPNHPPIGRRFFFGIFGILCGFFGSLAGIKQLDLNRCFYGYILISGSLLWAASGLLLWWLLNFRWSWGWWLCVCYCYQGQQRHREKCTHINQ